MHARKDFIFNSNIKDMARQCGIRLPSRTPLSHPPHRDRLVKWADSQYTPMLRRIAQKIVGNVNHVSFDRFLNQLQLTVNDFNEQSNLEPYILLIAESRLDVLYEGCSDPWVAGLAFEYCSLRAPEAILTINNLNEYVIKHPEIRHILILDDAAYSGNQKLYALHQIFPKLNAYLPAATARFFQQKVLPTNNHPTPLNLYLGITHMSSKAKKKILPQISTDDDLNSVLLCHAAIPTVMEMLDENETNYAINLGLDLDHPVTYFDHKIPDFFSILQPFVSGTSLMPERIGVQYMRFLGYTYQSDHGDLMPLNEQQWNTLFRACMPLDSETHNLPEIVPPYRFNQFTPAAPSNHFHHYPKTTVSLEKQSAFDRAVIEGNWKTTTYDPTQDLARERNGRIHNNA